MQPSRWAPHPGKCTPRHNTCKLPMARTSLPDARVGTFCSTIAESTNESGLYTDMLFQATRSCECYPSLTQPWVVCMWALQEADPQVAEGGAMEDFLTEMPVGPSSSPSGFYPTLDPLPRLPTGLFPPLLWDDEVAPQGQADLFSGSAPTVTTPGLVQPSVGGTKAPVAPLADMGASSNTTRLTGSP